MPGSNLLPEKWILLILIISIGVIGLISVSFWIFNPILTIQQDSKWVPCDQKPSFNSAQQIFNSHQDTVEEIKNLNPEYVFVSLVEPCPGKGGIEIMYDTMNTRNKIKSLIGAKFLGVPYGS
ncbi:MAG: hypothetical protein ACW97X_13225 [Candidatus Hodarchaeales archaeon]